MQQIAMSSVHHYNTNSSFLRPHHSLLPCLLEFFDFPIAHLDWIRELVLDVRYRTRSPDISPTMSLALGGNVSVDTEERARREFENISLRARLTSR